MMRYLIIGLMLLATGCVSFGLECKSDKTHGWVKIRRFAFAPGRRNVEALGMFKEKICP